MNRPYQTTALANSRKDWEAGNRDQLFVMATGTGKTHTFAQLPETYKDVIPGQMLVLAHRDELLEQAIKKLRIENPGKKIGKEKADEYCDPTNDDIMVASVQSMNFRRREKFNRETITITNVDEAHHSTGDSYTGILEHLNLYGGNRVSTDRRLLAGWTATPNRADGQGLSRVYRKISFSYSIRDAINDGWLVDVKGYSVRTDTSLDNVKVSGGKFNEKDLSDTVNTPARNSRGLKAWQIIANGRQTIGFTVDIQHAKDCAEMANAMGINACAVWGEDPERKVKLADFLDGVYDIVFNCGVLTEGFDMWQVGCVLNMKPMLSPVQYAQSVGRATRLEQLADGSTPNLHDHLKDRQLSGDYGPYKEDCLVIDMLDNYKRNSIVSLPTLMGLPGKLNLQGKSMVWAAKQVEQAQKDFPGIDLSELPSIDGLAEFIQQVNLFDVPFRPEVEANSEMAWHTSASGGYILLMPNKEVVKIEQNLLDKYQISATIDNKKYAGERDTLEQAFQAADGLIIKMRPEAVTVIKREAAWHDGKATEAQLKLLRKLYKGRQIPDKISKGKASKLISSALAGKG